MDDGEDAYEVLGLSQDAAEADIKKAYRKLALKHHPDKQTTEEGRKNAHAKFAKISNAYELLGDAKKKQEYDHQRKYGTTTGSRSQDHGSSSSNRRQRSRDQFEAHFHHHNHHHNQFHNFRFHDPFEIFEQFVRQEHHGGGNPQVPGHGGGTNNTSSARRSNGHFDNPFFQNPMGMGMNMGMGMGSMGMGMGSMGMNMGMGNMFNDPFFGGGGGGGITFGRSTMGGTEDPFAMMQQQQQNMMPMMGTTSSSFMSSSSSRFGGGGPGMVSTSTSTTTRIVNGRQQTVTETVTQNADGTVERQVHTSGDGGSERHRPALERPPPSRQQRLTGGTHARASLPQLPNHGGGDQTPSMPKRKKKRTSSKN